MSGTEFSVPIIDIERIGLQRNDADVDNAALTHAGEQMKKAIQKYGFFYAINHGISIDSVEKIMASAKSFFQGPLEEKKPHSRGDKGELGWIGMGTERSNPGFQADMKEVFNYHPADSRNDSMKSDFDVINKGMYASCSALALRILDALSVTLGYQRGQLREAHNSFGKADNQTLLRNLFYPAMPTDWEVTPGQIRLGEHTDYGTVTLNFQDATGGLEMNTVTSGCIPVTPIKGTVVVFVGRQMQQLTADALVAGRHKIRVPDDEIQARKERQSMVFVVRADDNYIIKCLDGSDKYEPVSSVDYLNYRQAEVIV